MSKNIYVPQISALADIAKISHSYYDLLNFLIAAPPEALDLIAQATRNDADRWGRNWHDPDKEADPLRRKFLKRQRKIVLCFMDETAQFAQESAANRREYRSARDAELKVKS